MKPVTPFLIFLLLALMLNAFPFVMALFSEAWMSAGWAYLFFTVPAGIVLLIIGAIFSVVLATKK